MYATWYCLQVKGHSDKNIVTLDALAFLENRDTLDYFNQQSSRENCYNPI